VFRTIVDVERARAVELLAAQQRRLAGLLHLGLAQHLADDYLDVLVVDLHTLQAVDVLDLAHQVVRQRLDALQAQDVMRVGLAVGDDFATLHGLAFEDVELAPFRNQLLVLLAVVRGDESGRRLPLVSLPKLTVPDFSARIAGSLGLRASNRSATRGKPPVMSRVLEDSCGNARDDIAQRHACAVLETDERARRQGCKPPGSRCWRR